MSNIAQSYVWQLDEDLSSTCKFVLMALAHRANIKDDEPGVYKCWPSTTCIANDTRNSRKTVQRAINELVNRGLITKEVRVDKTCGMKIASVYRIPGVSAYAQQMGLQESQPQMGHSDPSMGQKRPSGRVTESHKLKNKNKKIYPQKPTARARGQYPLAFEEVCDSYPGFKQLRMSKSHAFEAWSGLTGQEQADLVQAIQSYKQHLSENKWKSPRHLDRFLEDRYWKNHVPKSKTRTDPQPKEQKNGYVLECEGTDGKKALTVDEAVEICIKSQSPMVTNSVANKWHVQLLDFVQKMHRMPFPDEVEPIMANAKKINDALDKEDIYTSPVIRKQYEFIRKKREDLGKRLLQKFSA